MTGLSLLLVLLAFAGTEPHVLIVSSVGNDRDVTVVARAPEHQFRHLRRGEVAKADGRKLLQFSVLSDGKPGRPMLGTYTRNGDTLKFSPRFPLVRGTTYRATLALPDADSVTADYVVARASGDTPATVTNVYPTAPVLPANALKFYIHFSRPMRRGRAIFNRIRLLDEDGQEIADPWRRTELWTADDRRFTLWIHPGRVKQGVNLREELGPVLHPRRRYSLVIDRSVQDDAGLTLAREFRHEFRTAEEDHARILPQEWKLSVPFKSVRAPLRVMFGKPLDHALLQRCLEVRDSSGAAVDGHWSTGQHDSAAQFVPRAAWKSGDFQLVVDGILEDVAGNTPLRAFDTDTTRDPGPRPTLRVPFSIGS